MCPTAGCVVCPAIATASGLDAKEVQSSASRGCADTIARSSVVKRRFKTPPGPAHERRQLQLTISNPGSANRDERGAHSRSRRFEGRGVKRKTTPGAISISRPISMPRFPYSSFDQLDVFGCKGAETLRYDRLP